MFDTDKIWRCDCGDSHFISITGFNEMTDKDGRIIEPLRYFNIDGYFIAPNWGARFKRLWSMLRNGYADSWIGVALDRKTMIEIRDEIDRLINIANEEKSHES